MRMGPCCVELKVPSPVTVGGVGGGEEGGAGGIGTSFQHNDFWDHLAGHL